MTLILVIYVLINIRRIGKRKSLSKPMYIDLFLSSLINLKLNFVDKIPSLFPIIFQSIPIAMNKANFRNSILI